MPGLLAFLFRSFEIAFYGFFAFILWNAFIPTIFGVPSLTYLQGVILYLLSNVLIRGELFSSQGMSIFDIQRAWYGDEEEENE